MKLNKIVFVLTTALVLVGCGSDNKALVVSADDFCDINSPKGEINAQDELLAWGWAFDKSTGKIPESISMQFISEDTKNGLRIELNRDSRPDVAKAFNLPVEMAGYKTKINLKTLTPGVYSVSIVQGEDGKLLLCTSKSKLILK